MRHTVPVVALILMAVLPALPVRSAQSAALKVVVIAGEDAVNIIQQKTAVAPIVEVRDRNDLPVAGALVTFSVTGKSATFGTGAQTFALATDSAGRAVATGFSPVASGPVQINVQASYQGQTAGTTITQTNVLTAAQAAATTGSTAASAGAAAGGGAGGGLSAGAITGIVGAGVGGAALGAKALKREDPPPGNTVTTPPATPAVPVRIAVSPTGRGIREVTAFIFTASGGRSASPAYTWDFGDGTGASGSQVTHVFNGEGVFQVTVRIADQGGQSGATIGVGGFSGTWGHGGGGDSGSTLSATQDGNRVSGQWSRFCAASELARGECSEFVTSFSGFLRSPREISLSNSHGCLTVYDGVFTEDLNHIDGVAVNRNPVCLFENGTTAASFNLDRR